VSAEHIAAAGLGPLPTRETRSSAQWFAEHYHDAADAVLAFFAEAGIDLAGRSVADIGAGDGTIDLGVAVKGRPERLVGFDVVETDMAALAAMARREGVVARLPENLEFRTSRARSLPAEDDSFDLAFSWSTFEHVTEPTALLREVRRVLRPHGVLMIQIWPFFHSQHGSHLWHWFPEGFVQLLRDEADIEAAVRRRLGPDPEWAEVLLAEFRSCNRLTLDGLQAALLAAGFHVAKLELLTEPVHVPPELERYPLSQLGVAGVKLLAGIRADGVR